MRIYVFHIFTAIIQPYRVNKWLIDHFFRCTVYYACLQVVLVIESQRNRSFTPFPNDFFRWSETSCLEMLLFSSSSRFDEEGLEEWTFSRGRVLERVSYFTRAKKYCFESVCCSVIQLQTLRINGSARLVLYPLQNFAVIDMGWNFYYLYMPILFVVNSLLFLPFCFSQGPCIDYVVISWCHPK